ncbi:MAG: cupin domain-containing protein [Omnitrophica WOR_2 bacterium]
MHMKPENLPVLFEQGGSSLRGTEWGGMMVLLYTIPAGTDMKPLMTGMPGDFCQCPHWGYVLKGRVRIQHADHDQVVTSGDIFYVEPAHSPCFEEDTQMIEFSPKEPWFSMIETLSRNLAALSSTS